MSRDYNYLKFYYKSKCVQLNWNAKKSFFSQGHSLVCNSEFKLPIGGQDPLLCDAGTCSHVCIIPYTGSHVYTSQIYFIFNYMCMCRVCVCEFRCPWRSEENIGFPGIVFTGNCEPVSVVVGKQTRILYKSSTYSYLLSSLSKLKQIVKNLVRPVIMLKVKYCLVIVGDLKFTLVINKLDIIAVFQEIH